MGKLKKITRDDDGLISDGSIEYIFTEDGLIDWRKMVKNNWLVPNKQRTDETDVSKLKDYQLIILLGGIKELAQVRGYTNVDYTVTSPSSDYVVATCNIKWTPNYETEGQTVTFSAIGDASPTNTASFARHFLGPIAENRAFVRCVRNFLRINIVAKEELGETKLSTGTNLLFEETEENTSTPMFFLKQIMKEKGVNFEQIKKKLVKEQYEEAETLNSLDSLPKNKMFELIERIKTINK